MISPDFYGVVKLSLVFGIILGLLLWELRSVRRAQREDREKAARSEAESAGPHS